MKFMSQEVNMRFVFSPSQCNKSKTTTETNFSNLKKTKYHESLGQNEKKKKVQKYFLLSNQKSE